MANRNSLRVTKVPTKPDQPIAVSSSQYLKSKGVRKKIGKVAAKKAKESPPKSKIKNQSSKTIGRKAGRISYDGTR
jgi:hypothetical protein